MANTLLLTYFGPFPGVPVNPTVALAEGAVRALNTARPDLRVVARELPVSYDGSSAALRAALQGRTAIHARILEVTEEGVPRLAPAPPSA